MPLLFLGMFIFSNYLALQKYTFFYNNITIQRDKRVSLMTDILTGIKSIKFLSWERIFNQKIEEIR